MTFFIQFFKQINEPILIKACKKSRDTLLLIFCSQTNFGCQLDYFALKTPTKL